jgi:hypothetical protein
MVSVSPARNKHTHLFTFLGLSLLFAIAYAQSPLYTSNQDQYFLHAYARLGYGYLSQDWLANTLDPTPVFTELVYLTLRYLRLPALFYVYYAMLMGVYLFSLLGIAGEIWDEDDGRLKAMLLVALLFLVNSAGWRFAVSRTMGDNWSYILEDGVADQRMLGPVFEPSSFGVFLMLSVYLFLRRKPYLAVLAVAVSATFHATYLLPAGMLTLTYMYLIWKEEHSLEKAFWVGLVALLAVTPTVYYAATLFSASSVEIAAKARQILVDFRIPHHALVSQWLDATAVVKILLVILALYLVRKRRIFWILFIPALLSVVLTLAQVITGNLSLALLFPWRVSILLLPLAVTLILVRILDWVMPFITIRAGLFRFASLALIGITVIVGGIRFGLDLERKAGVPERGLYQFVSQHKLPGEVYLIPVKMQDFRLESGAPVYIDFKSIPYKDVEVVEWYQRNLLANRFYQKPDCAMLPKLITQGITNVITSVEQKLPACPGWMAVYTDTDYSVSTHVVR